MPESVKYVSKSVKFCADLPPVPTVRVVRGGCVFLREWRVPSAVCRFGICIGVKHLGRDHFATRIISARLI